MLPKHRTCYGKRLFEPYPPEISEYCIGDRQEEYGADAAIHHCLHFSATQSGGHTIDFAIHHAIIFNGCYPLHRALCAPSLL